MIFITFPQRPVDGLLTDQRSVFFIHSFSSSRNARGRDLARRAHFPRTNLPPILIPFPRQMELASTDAIRSRERGPKIQWVDPLGTHSYIAPSCRNNLFSLPPDRSELSFIPHRAKALWKIGISNITMPILSPKGSSFFGTLILSCCGRKIRDASPESVLARVDPFFPEVLCA